MHDVQFIWDLPDEPDGNYAHIAEHDVTPDEYEEAFHDDPSPPGTSRSSGRPIKFGWTSTGKHLGVVFEIVLDDPFTVYPVTAFPAPPRRGKKS